MIRRLFRRRKRAPAPALFLVANHTEPVFGIEMGAGVLFNVHPPDRCAGETCVIHSPSDHHMVGWPMNWRGDKREMERTCPHGIGHPDPDDATYQRSVNPEWSGVHGCDGCCFPGRQGWR